MPPGSEGIDLPPDAAEHVDLLVVMVGMAGGAIGGRVDDLVVLQRVLDLQVAIEAVDLVVGDVLLVHELVVVDPLEIALAVVADQAALAGHLAVAADQVAVAVGAVDALLVGQIVAERDAAAQVELLVGNLVAARAGAQTLVERLVLEMAEEAGGRGDRHVLALDDLAVAARAAQLLAAAQSRSRCGVWSKGMP